MDFCHKKHHVFLCFRGHKGHVLFQYSNKTIEINLSARFVKLQINIFIDISIGCDWTGTTKAETWKCCSTENGSQCGIEEENCYSDDECFWHLKCGTGNCQDQNLLSNFPPDSNCCYDPIPSKMKNTVKLLYLFVDGSKFF